MLKILGYIGLVLFLGSYAVMYLFPQSSIGGWVLVVGGLLCAPKVLWEGVKYTMDWL